MKKLIYLITMIIFIVGCDKDEKETTGSIYGTVSDKSTNDLVPGVNVSITPGGKSTVTGTDGRYEFPDLEAGSYTINVTKENYNSGKKEITVTSGKKANGDLSIERIPAIIKVDKEILDFGEALDINTLSFSIVNQGYQTLEWAVEHNCPWIKSIAPNSGTLEHSITTTVTVVINRDKLAGGSNETIVVAKSSNGKAEITIKAVGKNKSLPTLNTLEVSDITSSTAKLNGEITATGSPSYTERGFVYATSSMPTIENTITKPTAIVSEEAKYSAYIKDLSIDKKYYVRAYAKNDLGIAYSSNECVFETIVGMPEVITEAVTNKSIATGSVTFNGKIISVGDPTYTKRGFVYGVTHNPTLENGVDIPTIGSGEMGLFSENVTKIAIATTYYVRAYATNIKGTVYGSEISFNFNAVSPLISSISITNIFETSATFSANISEVGDPAYIERGFVYDTSMSPTIGNSPQIPVIGSGLGDFSANVTGLTKGTTYYVRAYAKNTNENVIYLEKSFSTKFTLSGTVRDNLTNNIIPNASIVFKQGTSTVAQMTTNDTGDFSVSNFSFGTYNVTLAASGYETKTQSVSISNPSLALTMTPLATVTGVIIDDDGIPLKNVNVRLSSNSYSNRVDETVKTNSAGEYIFSNIPAQEYNMYASFDNYKSIDKYVAIISGNNTINLAMQIIYDAYIVTSGNFSPSVAGLNYIGQSGLEGTTITSTIQIKNARQKNVSWSLSNIPSNGIKFNSTNGTILAGETISINATFTYPNKGLTGCVRLNTTACGASYPYTYVWGWETADYSGCGQTIKVSVGESNVLFLNIFMEQRTCWSN